MYDDLPTAWGRHEHWVLSTFTKGSIWRYKGKALRIVEHEVDDFSVLTGFTLCCEVGTGKRCYARYTNLRPIDALTALANTAEDYEALPS